MKVSEKKFPKSALALYVKLYCKKKAATKNKQDNLLMEATKSWVSLSKNDKQYFFDLFQGYQSKLNNKFASNLQSAQPYLKRKDQSKLRPCNKYSKDINLEQTLPPNNHDISDQNNYSQCISNNETNEIQEPIEHLENSTLQSTHFPEPSISRSISEPSPPVRTSVELFEVIKSNSEDMQNIKWTDLSKTQKQRYQKALSTIKNDYIIQYTTYLEQLTPKQLFYHYKSKF